MQNVARLTTAANDEVEGSCRRGAKRLSVFLSGSIQTASSDTRVIIRDMSRTGALVESPVMPPVGSYVLFKRGDITVRAKVVRRGGKRTGLEFQEEIDEAALLICMGEATPLRSKH